MVFSSVKGHLASNEVPTGKITSFLCLDRPVTMSKPVSCSRMEKIPLKRTAPLRRMGFAKATRLVYLKPWNNEVVE